MEGKKKMRKKKTLEKKAQKKKNFERTMQKKRKKNKPNQTSKGIKKKSEPGVNDEEIDWDLPKLFEEGAVISIPSSKRKVKKEKQEVKKEGEEKKKQVKKEETVKEVKKTIDKKAILRALYTLGRIEKDHHKYLRELISLTQDHEERAELEMNLADNQKLGRNFDRKILDRSENEAILEKLYDEVKIVQDKARKFVEWRKMEVKEKKKEQH